MAHDALINGLRAYLGDKAAEQEKILARLETSSARRGRPMSFESRAIRLERAHGRAGADDIVVTVAADFLHGGEPTFARVFDRRGSLLLGLQRLRDEPWRAFEARARVEAGKVAGACSLLIGGLPDGGGDVGGDSGEGNVSPLPTDDLPRGAITLPEAALHCSQIEALELVRQHRRVALVAGRRWGKSTILITLAVDAALSGRRVGMFAPTRTLMSPLLMEIARALRPIAGASVNTVLGEIRLPNGGHVDFWSVDHSQRAGRGRKYHLVLIDEAAHDEGYLTDTFPSAIAPTLIDYAGAIVEASTPNGVEPTNHFWQCAHLAELGFVVHHAPTSANPHLPAEEIRALRATMRPEIASQELDALFVSLEGMSIFPLASLLENGEPVPDRRAYRHDWRCDQFGRGRRRLRTRRHGGNRLRHASTARRSWRLRGRSSGDFGLGHPESRSRSRRRMASARQRSLSPLDPARAAADGSRRHLDREAGDGPQAA